MEGRRISRPIIRPAVSPVGAALSVLFCTGVLSPMVPACRPELEKTFVSIKCTRIGRYGLHSPEGAAFGTAAPLARIADTPVRAHRGRRSPPLVSLRHPSRSACLWPLATRQVALQTEYTTLMSPPAGRQGWGPHSERRASRPDRPRRDAFRGAHRARVHALPPITAHGRFACALLPNHHTQGAYSDREDRYLFFFASRLPRSGIQRAGSAAKPRARSTTAGQQQRRPDERSSAFPSCSRHHNCVDP